MKTKTPFESGYEIIKESALADLITFLSLKSISSEKENEIQKTAEWLAKYLQNMGFSTKILKTEGHPTVYAENMEAGEDKPTVLIYGHYDVQPVDPLALWKTPPFEPRIENGQVYARGAQDNKGQIFYCIQGVRALLTSGNKLPVNVKFLIEGEEEIGSPHLPKLLEEKKELFKSDYCIVADLNIPAITHPAISLGLRGIVTMDVHFKGSNGDLHSGMHGGLAFNPNHALAQVLSSLRSPEGTILVPGFYDDVIMPSDSFLKEVFEPYTEESYLQQFGCKPTGGEQKLSLFEKGTLRPTLEVNGIHGGYAGSGIKTVIPSVAVAKISCRLVPDQDPDVIGLKVKNFIEGLAPAGITVEVHIHKGKGAPVRADSQSPIVQAVKSAYEEVFNLPCRFTMEGGTIPIVPKLISTISPHFVLMGLGLPDDEIHAPNERFGLDRYEMGAHIIAKTLENIAGKKNYENC